jgi:hypothetical protein
MNFYFYFGAHKWLSFNYMNKFLLKPVMLFLWMKLVIQIVIRISVLKSHESEHWLQVTIITLLNSYIVEIINTMVTTIVSIVAYCFYQVKFMLSDPILKRYWFLLVSAVQDSTEFTV